MTAREFLEKMKDGTFDKPPFAELCGCGCGKPLAPGLDGERQIMGGKVVNADCYWDKLGDLVEEHLI